MIFVSIKIRDFILVAIIRKPYYLLEIPIMVAQVKLLKKSPGVENAKPKP